MLALMGPKNFSVEWLVHHSQLVVSIFEAPAKSVFFPGHPEREYLSGHTTWVQLGTLGFNSQLVHGKYPNFALRGKFFC